MNVLIIDSQTLIRDGLNHTVRDHLPDARIHQAENYDAATRLLDKQQFQLIIMEINVQPEMGPAWVSEIKKNQQDARILIYSAFNGDIYAVPFLSAGADGFVSKTASVYELTVAVDTILRDGKYLSVELQTGLISKVTDTARQKGPNPIFLLSTKEKKVLELVIQGKSTKEMSYMLGLKSNTISTYKHRIFRKMQVTNPIELSARAALWS